MHLYRKVRRVDPVSHILFAALAQQSINLLSMSRSDRCLAHLVFKAARDNCGSDLATSVFQRPVAIAVIEQ
jgi:hypothetical protein